MAETKTTPIIDEILALTDTTKIIKELTKDEDYIEEAKVNQDEYDGKHKVLDRKDKKIGEGADEEIIPVAKLITTFQKTIVNLAVAFIVGRPVKYVLDSEDNTEDAFKLINNVFRANKIQYFDRKLVRQTMIETRTAELWFAKRDAEENPKSPTDPDYIASKIGVQLLTYKLGYSIFPHFDQYGDMDAFTVTYEMEKFVEASKKVKTVKRVDIYTATKFIFYEKSGSKWDAIVDIPNQYGKIPIIYYTQETAEWKDVQTLIDRYENHISTHADENDYYSAPIILIKGNMLKPPDKTQTGKLLQFKPTESPDGKGWDYGDAKYLTWDNEPQSMKMEGDNLKDLIYTLTSTPDISFSSVKGITNLSGIAIKMMFFDATLKALNHQETFGEGFTRRFNLMKTILSFTQVASKGQLTEVSATPQFQDPTPRDIKENIAVLSEALAGDPVMSEDTALRNNLLVTDVEKEKEKMKEDRERKSASSGFEAGSFNL